jgi:hypothetical protein
MKKNKKNKKVIKRVYGGVIPSFTNNDPTYSSFAPQAPIMDTGMSAPIINTDMSSQVMDDGMSDPMGGYKKGGSIKIGKVKDYIKDLL